MTTEMHEALLNIAEILLEAKDKDIDTGNIEKEYTEIKQQIASGNDEGAMDKLSDLEERLYTLIMPTPKTIEERLREMDHIKEMMDIVEGMEIHEEDKEDFEWSKQLYESLRKEIEKGSQIYAGVDVDDIIEVFTECFEDVL